MRSLFVDIHAILDGSTTRNNPESQTVKRKRENLLDIEANEKVEGDVGLEAGGVDAEQLEHFSLPVRVEEAGAVEGGEEEVEDNEDYQVVVDQLQHRAPVRHNHIQENTSQILSFQLNLR